ncbi:major facilitator superfamily transporter [Ligilactobacillus salitolerans]|uniref:Major facilitator superfamily transporter n=1 Tax=Ligilactobacillus salitolerans TaxID=1808352 RepID=A0A401ISA8_9LACO|nr:MFS transporter [Ligilactobacillus salitolerans]GBG94397.1 major facilitator superfamily transporter [Ligilactobacillus salitolerans]
MEKEGLNEAVITDRESNWQIAKDIATSFIGSLSGDMFAFGMGLMLLDQTHLAISFGIEMIITPLVGLACLIPVGNLVDRHRHKRILNFSTGLRLLALVIFALAIDRFAGAGKLVPVVLFLIINTFSVNINNATYTSSVHELVNRQKIQKLNSLVQGAGSLATIASPALGTALYSVVGFDMFIYIEIGATALSWLILQTMHFHYAPMVQQEKSTVQNTLQGQFKGFKEGLVYLKKRSLLTTVIAIAIVLNFIFTSLNIGLPFVIKNQLGFGNTPVGYLNSAFSFGMLVGSLLLGLFSKSNNLKTRLMFPMILLGVEISLLGGTLKFTQNPTQVSVIGSLVMASIGITLLVLNVTIMVRLQQTVPTQLLGRVSTLLTTANTSVEPLGTIFYTIVFQKVLHGSLVFIVNGSVMLVYTLIMIPLMMKAIKNEAELDAQVKVSEHIE